MTISSTTRKAGPFFGNDATTAFPFAFKVFKKQDVTVTLTTPQGVDVELVLDSDFTVILNTDQDASPGGTITYPRLGVPMAAGYRLTITGGLAYTQPTDIQNSGGFYPQTIEDMGDRSTIQIQQLLEQVARSLKFSVSDAGTDPTLPPADIRANKVLGFDNTGAPVAVVPISGSAGEVAIDLANLIADLASASGAGLLGFSHDGFYASGSVGRKLRQSVDVKDAPFFALGNGAASKDHDRLAVAAALTYAASVGVPCIISDGIWDIRDFNPPSFSRVVFTPGAVIRPTQHSTPGAICSNVSDVNPFRTDIDYYNPRVDGSLLSFTGPGGNQDNGIGYATGAVRIRVFYPDVRNFIANFDGPGPGGKGCGFEEGVRDSEVIGGYFENVTYPLFGSPTLGDPNKTLSNLRFRGQTIRRCACVFWALTDAGTATVPTGDPDIFSMSVDDIYAEDVGHFPDVSAATGRFEKTGAILMHGASNVSGDNIRIFNHSDYPSVAHPAGGTRYPHGYPDVADGCIGSGLSGPIGSVIQGWGRNIKLNVEYIGDCDDGICIAYPRAHRANVFGGNVQPVGSPGWDVRLNHQGNKLGWVRSGYVGGTAGTLQAGGAAAVTLSAAASERNGEYAGLNLVITGGTGSGQTRRIMTYNGTTKVATVDPVFSPAPDATSTFSVSGTTTAVADGNISGFISCRGDAPSGGIVHASARFPTTLALEANSPTGVRVSGSMFEVYSLSNTFAAGSNVRGGSWTPTLFNTTNVSASTAFVCMFTRVGNTVTVSGTVSITPAGAGTVDLDMTPPIAAVMATATQAGGTFSDQGRESGSIIVDTTTNRLRLRIVAVSTANRTFGFSGSYRIVN